MPQRGTAQRIAALTLALCALACRCAASPRWTATGGPLGGLGYDIRIHPVDPDRVYVTDAWSGVSVSADGGATWQRSNAGLVTRAGPSGDAVPAFSLTIDPNDPRRIWAGTQDTRGIFHSVDGGGAWTERMEGVVEEHGITFRGFAVKPGDSDTVYAAAEVSSFVWSREGMPGREFDRVRGVVYRTVDGGESWNAVWRGDNLARHILMRLDRPDAIYVSTGIFDREAANSDPATGDPGGVGVLKSRDGGRTWTRLGTESGLRNLYVGSLAMRPSAPDTLLAGCGNNAYPDHSGAYLTTDGGATWSATLPTGHEPVTAVEFALHDTNVAYAGTASAIYRSEDAGGTWSRVTAGPVWGPRGVRAGVPIDFAVDPRDARRLFANNYGGGVFLSEDGGATWCAASRGMTGAQLHDIAVDPTDPRRAATIGRTGPFLTTDAGKTWTGLNHEPATFAEWYAVAIDPSDPRRLLISDEHTGTLLSSSDSGSTWTHVYDHVDVQADDGRGRHGFRALEFAPSDPRVVYAGMSRDRNSLSERRAGASFGLHVSRDGGSTWEHSDGPPAGRANVSDIAVNPTDANAAHAATTDYGVLRTEDGGRTWSASNRGLRTLAVEAIAVSPHDLNFLCAGPREGGVYTSYDGGDRWRPSGGGMDPAASVVAIAYDPIDPDTIYASDVHSGVYRTEDGGWRWAPVNDGLSTRAVTALGMAADGSFLYAATEGGGVFTLEIAR